MAGKFITLQIGKLQSSVRVDVDPSVHLGAHARSGRNARRTKNKTVIVLNSHSLSDYQRCPKRYEFNALVQIEIAYKKKVWELGTYWGKMLEIYYRCILKYGDKWRTKKGVPTKDWTNGSYYHQRLDVLTRRMANCADNEENGFDDETRGLLSTRIRLYAKFYANEVVKVLGVEVGYSIVLYEDKNVIFVYEGRMDRVLQMKNPFNPNEWVVAISDDKTRGRNIDLVEFNNQVYGYLLAAKTNWFVYNYMGKQMEGGPSKYFQRQLVYREQALLEKWKDTTIKWYWRLLADRAKGEFLESMQCPGEYSNCEFLPLCSAQSKYEYNAAMADKFKKRDGERKSW